VLSLAGPNYSAKIGAISLIGDADDDGQMSKPAEPRLLG